MGCRFPGGAHSPAAFWTLLQQGVDAIVEVPPDRWSSRRFYDPDRQKPGKMYVNQGGFLQSRLDTFDAAFFGISPREAATLDPQQRLLLEVTWEAYEDAGWDADRLRGANIGVYIGGFTWDSNTQQLNVLNREIITPNTATGIMLTMLASRLSYTFDLRGPCMTVDTACSASLVALHMACQALWHGECDAALSGGVNLVLRPEVTIAMCKGGFLSPDARCRAFDASANGYVRGEGAGLVLLKPLAAAVADGDTIHALILATGVNQDGRTQGITVPNGEAQQQLIRDVCRQAGIAPHQLHYVEAHGTGTPAGDPVEAAALGAVLSPGRPAGDQCWMGSVKTNIGHLEAAAGIAGVIKTVLMLKHKAIPAHLHFQRPHPRIDLEALGLRIPQRTEPWPTTGVPARAGINSFGYGGTNAHAILQEAPTEIWAPGGQTSAESRAEATVREPPQAAPHGEALLVPISARSEESLVLRARDYAQFLDEHPQVEFSDLAYTLAVRRHHGDHRLAVITRTGAALHTQLGAFVQTGSTPGLVAGRARPGSVPRVAFVYTGMSAQWWGMGTELLEHEPLFRQVVQRCDAVWGPLAGWSLWELFAQHSGEPMSEPRHAQPANLVLQIGLTELWRSYGLIPDAMLGHSVGEIAAAYAAGVLSLEGALRLTYYRCTLQQRTLGQGAMLAVGLGSDAVQPYLAAYGDRIEVAAYNSPHSITLAGDPEALRQLAMRLEAQRIFNRWLRVDVAYHSAQMDPLHDDFVTILADLQADVPALPLYSTVTGNAVAAGEQTVDYWWRNVRQPVCLAQALDAMLAASYDTFVEIGPNPVLASAIQECLAQRQVEGYTVPSLRRQQPERETLLAALGALYTHGVVIDWRKLYPAGRLLTLPTYPWRREPLWHETEVSKADRLGVAGHPLLQPVLGSAEPTWEGELSAHFLPYLNEHVVEDTVIFPGAGYVEAGLMLAGDSKSVAMEGLTFHKALPVHQSPIIQLRLDEGSGEFRIYSRPLEERTAWTLHATGKLVRGALGTPSRHVLLADIQARCRTEVARDDVYRSLEARGLHYGPSFQGIRRLWQGKDEVLTEIQVSPAVASDLQAYRLHPLVLDPACQSFIAAVDEDSTLYLPVRIGEVRWYNATGTHVWSYGRIVKRSERTLVGDLTLCDDTGRVVVEVFGLQLQAIGVKQRANSTMPHPWLYDIRWEQSDEAPDSPLVVDASGHRVESLSASYTAHEEPLGRGQNDHTGQWLIFADRSGIGDALGAMLQEYGASCITISPGLGFTQVSATHFEVAPDSLPELQQLLDAVAHVPMAGIVYLWGVDLALHAADHMHDEYATGATDSVRMLHLVQTLTANHVDHLQKLAIVTCHSQPVVSGDAVTAPGQAALWGLGRVIANEYPGLGTVMIDLDAHHLPPSVRRLAMELLGDSPETEIAFRHHTRYVQRLMKAEAHIQSPTLASVGTPFKLVVAKPGVIDSLEFQETERHPPGAGEIEMRVHAAALNFKDIMKVLDMLPDEYLEGTFFGTELGFECAGVVTAVGAGVERFQVGDAVVSLESGGAFRSFTTVPARLVVTKPTGLCFAESVCFLNFVTAYYSLCKMARLQPGERVLIHSATGGVGLAAVQIAQWVGAEIFATAGSEAKRDYLRSLGIQHVADSRSLGFVDDFRTATQGEGVDVVLNALSGEALLKSFELLAPYGRFIEIGKRDISANSKLAMRAFDHNLTFAAVDLDRVLVDRPQLIVPLMEEIYTLFQQGILRALPVTTFPAAQIADAFRHMAQARHMGKVVVQMADSAVPVHPQVRCTCVINGESSYLITGGFGGFGLAVAKWLVQQGGRHLILVSRHGPATPEAQEALCNFAQQGVQVLTACVDVADAAQMTQLMTQIQAQMPPLKGVVHAAAVLDDAMLAHLDRVRLVRVMAPKALGAWHLHKATVDLALDFFVCFSSISALIGNAGQGNYVAANAFLDGLVHYRRAQALPATSVNWGAIGEVGMVARNSAVAHHMQRLGIRSLPLPQALAALELVLQQENVQVGVMDVDWQQWALHNVPAAGQPRYRPVLGANGAHAEREHAISLQAKLQAAPSAERQAIAEAFVLAQAAQILRMPVARLDARVRLDQLGLDSLMMAELDNTIEAHAGVNVSMMFLSQGPTLAEVATQLLQQMVTVEEAEVNVHALAE